MALINCPECNKEVSDKADMCPNCGYPINGSIKMQPLPEARPENLMKCPICKSTQLTSNKKGFSGGKAAAGAILTGGIGLLAGTIGSGKIIITCLKCGHKFKPGEDRIIAKTSKDELAALQIMFPFVFFFLGWLIEDITIGLFAAAIGLLLSFIMWLTNRKGDSKPERVPSDEEIENEVRNLLRRNEYLNAMNFYKKAKKVNLDESQKYVDKVKLSI